MGCRGGGEGEGVLQRQGRGPDTYSFRIRSFSPLSICRSRECSGLIVMATGPPRKDSLKGTD